MHKQAKDERDQQVKVVPDVDALGPDWERESLHPLWVFHLATDQVYEWLLLNKVLGDQPVRGGDLPDRALGCEVA